MGYKQVDISDEEFKYYKSMVKSYSEGEDLFRDIFETDDSGFITLITPRENIPWAVLFFIQNVMINQRLRIIDKFRKQEKK